MQEQITQPCFAIEDIKTLQLLTPEQLMIIDVRNPDEYAVMHIPGAFNIPLNELESRSNELLKAACIVTVCGKGGGRSEQAAALLKQIGFNKANYLCGGTFGWYSVS